MVCVGNRQERQEVVGRGQTEWELLGQGQELRFYLTHNGKLGYLKQTLDMPVWWRLKGIRVK